MREYYPVEIKLNSSVRYLIWYTDENDGFLSKLSKPITFMDKNKLEQYANSETIRLESEFTIYDFNIIKKWIENTLAPIDCESILDVWNFFSDLLKSVNYTFKGDLDIDNTVDVYNKLFYGLNLPIMQKNGEQYNPNWDEKDIQKLKEILLDGILLATNLFQ